LPLPQRSRRTRGLSSDSAISEMWLCRRQSALDELQYSLSSGGQRKSLRPRRTVWLCEDVASWLAAAAVPSQRLGPLADAYAASTARRIGGASA
jgi:hypothetical protein